MVTDLSAPAARARAHARWAGGGVALRIVVGLVVAVLGTSWAWSNPYEAKATVDSFQYVRLAYRDIGDSNAQARIEAARVRCYYWRHVRPPESSMSVEIPVTRALIRRQCPLRERPVPEASPRYEAIFAGRPAFPALAAALLPSLHSRAFTVVTLALAVASGLALFVGALSLTGSAVAAAVATGALYAVPAGVWITRIGPEGGAMLGTVLAVQGISSALRPAPTVPDAGTPGASTGTSTAARVAPHRTPRWWGAALFVVGLLVTFAFKSANALVLVAVVASLLLALAAVRRAVTPLVLAAVAGACGVVLVGLNGLLHWPGASVTLQDTFTNHFIHPDVRSPWRLLLRADHRILDAFVRDAGKVGLLVLVCVAVLVLLMRAPSCALPWAALAPCGALVALAHPVSSEFPRLVLPLWVPVVVAMGVVVQTVLAGLGRGLRSPRHSLARER